MEKISRHNYEAYFLDFAEGNLSAIQIRELEEFLRENPELRSELDDFEIFELPEANSNTELWGSLKKPNLKALKGNTDLRDSFFQKAVENELSAYELEMLTDLLKENAFEKEYDLWKRIVLKADGSKMQKDDLYQFGIDQALSEFNYDYYLIARGEGLLSSTQQAELEKFVAARPNGARELAIADSIKLRPSQGIFYPNKSNLYQKEKKGLVIWLYRAAAIAAVLLLGVFIWNQAGDNPSDRAQIAKNIAQTQDDKAIPSDTSKLEKIVKQDSFPKTEVTEEPLLEDWQVREPDPVEYAESSHDLERTKSIESEDIIKTDYEEIESIDILGSDNLAHNGNNTKIILEDSIPTILELKNESDPNPETLAEAKPDSKYKTIPEIAEDLMAQKLNVPDSERDEMAMFVAKRLTSRASELLDAEYTKQETGEEGDESLTYTLRIGTFKVMRSKSK